MSLNIYGVIPAREAAARVLEFPKKKKLGLGLFFGDNEGEAYFSNNAGRTQVQDGLDQLFGTNGGERLMLPDFGLDVGRYLFEQMDEETVYRIKLDVKEQLQTYFADIVEIISIIVRLTDKGKYRGTPAILVILHLRIIETQEMMDYTGEL